MSCIILLLLPIKGLMHNMEDYSEYLIQGESDKHDRVRNWMAAIGLQDVDGLTPSNYMLETVRRNIEGEITIDEVGRLVDKYYTTQEGLKQEARILEADKMAVIGTSWNKNESPQETIISTQEIPLSTQQTTAERIIEEIRKHPLTTREKLAEVVGVTPGGIKKQLDKLKKAGKIRHVGATKKGHWEIIE